MQNISYTLGTDSVEHYRTATYPVATSNITYPTKTGMFADFLGLSLNETAYYAYGKAGTAPDFSKLDNLKFYKIDADRSNASDLIDANGTTEYNLYYFIDETELGFALNETTSSFFEYRVSAFTVSLNFDSTTSKGGVKFQYELVGTQNQQFEHDVIFKVNKNLDQFETFKVVLTPYADEGLSVQNKNFITTDKGATEVVTKTSLGQSYTFDVLAQAQNEATTLQTVTIGLKCAFNKTETTNYIGFVITDTQIA